MGNCQAAEAAMVVIQHPANNKVERIYWSVSAQQVMTSNPGHYVALVVTSPTARSDTGEPVKRLKLLRADDTLLIGQVYRLVSFQDVLKEFASKKCVKLGKLLKERGVQVMNGVVAGPTSIHHNSKSFNGNGTSVEMEQEQLVHPQGSNSGRSSGSGSRVGMRKYSGGQWKPALQTIAEFET